MCSVHFPYVCVSLLLFVFFFASVASLFIRFLLEIVVDVRRFRPIHLNHHCVWLTVLGKIDSILYTVSMCDLLNGLVLFSSRFASTIRMGNVNGQFVCARLASPDSAEQSLNWLPHSISILAFRLYISWFHTIWLVFDGVCAHILCML